MHGLTSIQSNLPEYGTGSLLTAEYITYYSIIFLSNSIHYQLLDEVVIGNHHTHCTSTIILPGYKWITTSQTHLICLTLYLIPSICGCHSILLNFKIWLEHVRLSTELSLNELRSSRTWVKLQSFHILFIFLLHSSFSQSFRFYHK